MGNVNAIGAVFLAVFFISLVSIYIIIRRNLLDIKTAGVVSAILNVSTLVAFGLTSAEIGDDLAIFGGTVVGLAFTGAMLTMASFFQKNQPENLAAYDAMMKQRQRPASRNAPPPRQKDQ
jgi:uncharacterized membrane protein YfcA